MQADVMLALSLAACRPLFIRRTGYGWDLVILVVSLPIMRQAEQWSKLYLQWAWLPGYLVLAMLLFLISVHMTAAQPKQYLQLAMAAGRVAPIERQLSWGLLSVATAVYEELIWRIVIQSIALMVLPAFAAIALTSILFTLWHRSRIGNNIWLGIELFAFSMVMGGLMFATNDPLSVVIAHLVRNHLVYMALYPNDNP